MERVLCRGHTADVRKRTFAFVGFSVKVSVRGTAVVMGTDSPFSFAGNITGWVEQRGGRRFFHELSDRFVVEHVAENQGDVARWWTSRATRDGRW